MQLLMLVLPALAVAASAAAQCGALIREHGFSANLPGKPMQYCDSIQCCCDFCHATANCEWWTWNGLGAANGTTATAGGNGYCYAKASNASGGGSPSMVSGGTTPGPPVPPPPPIVVALPNGVRAISAIEPTYASWNIDSSCNRGFHRTAFANPNLGAAAKGLAPSRLRFGGSGNDNLVYGLTPGSPACAAAGIVPPNATSECSYLTPGCLNATQMDALYAFAVSSGAELLFGVAFGLDKACAVTKATGAYKWDPANAQSLLDYLVATNKTEGVWGFELGNELNNHGGAPCNLTAEMQAGALLAFAPRVRAALPAAKFVGPDTGYASPEAWLAAYLPLVADGGATPLIHGVTHHVYPGISRNGFDSFSGLDSSNGEIEWYVKTIRAYADPKTQIWAGEDGPIGGGDSGTCGSKSVCGTYASALWYADDLANRAAFGFSQYQRQTFFGGAYGLTTSAHAHSQSALGATEAILLRPDYWVNFLWKRVLGTSVLNATVTVPTVRAYAFSGIPASPFAAPACRADGAVQLLLINLDAKANATVQLPAAAKSNAAAGVAGATFNAWLLEPVVNSTGGLDPFALQVRLNGEVLETTVDVSQGPSPSSFLEHIPVAAAQGVVSEGVVLPPLAVAFLCL